MLLSILRSSAPSEGCLYEYPVYGVGDEETVLSAAHKCLDMAFRLVQKKKMLGFGGGENANPRAKPLSIPVSTLLRGTASYDLYQAVRLKRSYPSEELYLGTVRTGTS